jgi:hypothetical protein
MRMLPSLKARGKIRIFIIVYWLVFSFIRIPKPGHAIGKEQGKVRIHHAFAGIALVIPKTFSHRHIAFDDAPSLFEIQHGRVSDMIEPRGTIIVQGFNKRGQSAIAIVM